MNQPDCGIVIPTLGTRTDYLMACIQSIRNAGYTYICVVSPDRQLGKNLLYAGFVEQFVFQSGTGIANAINVAFAHLPDHIQFQSWLGDDDLLEIDSMEIARQCLISNPLATAVYGKCRYIDSEGREIGVNKIGSLATRILRFGPCLIPQPGSLIRRTSFRQIGGLNESYECAFDLDMFLKLQSMGPIKYVNRIIASFRWHPNSKSVQQRNVSTAEASRIRKSHLPRSLQILSPLWEIPTKFLTLKAGYLLNFKSRKLDLTS
jgi:GT2 family glycosyltransferase